MLFDSNSLTDLQAQKLRMSFGKEITLRSAVNSKLACSLSIVSPSHLFCSASPTGVHVYSFNVPENQLEGAHGLLDKAKEVFRDLILV